MSAKNTLDLINQSGNTALGSNRKRGRGRPARASKDPLYEELTNPEIEEIEHEAFSISDSDFSHEDTVSWYIRHACHPILDQQKINELIIRAQAGDINARNRVVSHNLRLAFSVAKRYASGRSTSDFMDLIQEGNLGLVDAIKRFDPKLGFRFTTYATWWIRQKICYQVNGLSTVTIRQSQLEAISYIRRVKNSIEQTLGRVATGYEVFQATDGRYTLKKVRYLLSCINNNTIVSLDSPSNLDQRKSLYDDLVDDFSLAPDTILSAIDDFNEFESRIMELVKAVKSLRVSEKAKLAFFKYYGLDGHKECATYHLTGLELGVTRERVRQMVEKVWTRIVKQFRYGKNIPTWQEMELKYSKVVTFENITGRSCTVTSAVHGNKRYAGIRVRRKKAKTRPA